jgi:cytoskeletal protein RodZ
MAQPIQRDFLGQKKPHPMYVDEKVEKGFSLMTWAAAAVVLALLFVCLAIGMSAQRQTSAPATSNQPAVSPERTVPPSGRTGEVPGSRSPVQR